MSNPSPDRRRQTARVQNQGVRYRTVDLDGTTTEDVVQLGISASKVSFQRQGNLTATIEFSLNGEDFQDSTNISNAAIGSYDTHIVTVVKITRTDGEGSVVVAASE